MSGRKAIRPLHEICRRQSALSERGFMQCVCVIFRTPSRPLLAIQAFVAFERKSHRAIKSRVRSNSPSPAWIDRLQKVQWASYDTSR